MEKPYHYIIDLDGTIYRDEIALPYAADFIRYLDAQNRNYIFYTNCPEKTPANLQEVLGKIQIHVPTSKFLTSGIVTIEYLLAQGKPDISVYLIGSEDYRRMVQAAGITVLQGTDIIADYVVVAFDKQFNYVKMREACYHVLHGATLLATNRDESIPTPRGPIPHTGAILSSIEFAVKKRALVLGKPSQYSCQVLQRYLNCQVWEMCMIGDRLDTDMQFAKNNGFHAFLMMTGMTTEADIERHQEQLYQKKFHDLSELIIYDQSMTEQKRHAI